jgi:O-acetyl-ADP-ribose deacetylase (regulator of RNase III)
MPAQCFDKIQLIQGDITHLAVDAIVNAANSSLLGGGGVDDAIHRAGGSAILQACQAIRQRQGGCATGEAVITTAGLLPAKQVIHTVGPVWQGGQQQEAELLASCYRRCLQLAKQHQLRTIAFPNISTGIYGFPKAEAARIAVQVICDALPDPDIDQILFCCHDPENFSIYQNLLR